MEQTFAHDDSTPSPWAYPEGATTVAQPTILLVEDDRDIREMLTTLLEMAGFAVVSCGTAETGLQALREQQFDLLLTDYALPHRSGLWLLEAAETEGLIQGTPVLIVTAHTHVAGADAYEIIQKPFDLDDLLERVRRRMEGDGVRRTRKHSGEPTSGARGHGAADGDAADPIELILYVSAQSPRSYAAVRNVRRILERFNSSRVKLTVCDLSQEPGKGVEDSVAFTPTLVRRTPGPRTFILGHITNPELLMELLADCDAEDV